MGIPDGARPGRTAAPRSDRARLTFQLEANLKFLSRAAAECRELPRSAWLIIHRPATAAVLSLRLRDRLNRLRLIRVPHCDRGSSRRLSDLECRPGSPPPSAAGCHHDRSEAARARIMPPATQVTAVLVRRASQPAALYATAAAGAAGAGAVCARCWCCCWTGGGC